MSVVSAASRAHRPPYEWPNTLTGPSIAETTAAHIFGFALQVVGGTIATTATSAPVHCVNREALFEGGQDKSPRVVV